jgi:hypothetical protein
MYVSQVSNGVNATSVVRARERSELTLNLQSYESYCALLLIYTFRCDKFRCDLYIRYRYFWQLYVL